jgi:ABC-type iron transport system FetAB permease component
MSKSAEIEIPKGNIIISDLREYSRQLPVSYVLEVITDYLKYSKLISLGVFQKISDKINISKRIVKNSLKLNTSFIRKNFNKSSKIGLNISQNRSSIKYNQLNYTFSTSKYNEILKKPKVK